MKLKVYGLGFVIYIFLLISQKQSAVGGGVLGCVTEKELKCGMLIRFLYNFEF